MALFPRFDRFESRHIGTLGTDLAPMLKTVGVNSLNELIQQTVPDKIRLKEELKTPESLSEYDYLLILKDLADKNSCTRNFIGQGYFGSVTPSAILRNQSTALRLHDWPGARVGEVPENVAKSYLHRVPASAWHAQERNLLQGSMAAPVPSLPRDFDERVMRQLRQG